MAFPADEHAEVLANRLALVRPMVLRLAIDFTITL